MMLQVAVWLPFGGSAQNRLRPSGTRRKSLVRGSTVLGIECFRSLGYQRSKLHAIRSASASGSVMLCLSDGACYRPNFWLGEEGTEHSSSSSIYQIPNTEHMAYRLVRTKVYKRGVGISGTEIQDPSP